MAKYQLFDQTQAKRIGRAVRAYEAGLQGTPGNGRLLPVPQAAPTRVYNGTGAYLNAGQVVGLGDPMTLPSDDPVQLADFRNVAFQGHVPALPADLGHFAVLLQDCPAGKVAQACIAGVCPVKLNLTGASPDVGYCDVAAGQTAYLTPLATGRAEILWSDDGPGNVWAYIRIPDGGDHDRLFAATLDYNLARTDPTATVTVIGPLDGGDDLDTDPDEVGNSAGWSGMPGDVVAIRTTSNTSDLTLAAAWEIISIEESGRRIFAATLAEDLSGGDATASITIGPPLDGGATLAIDPDEVKNSAGWHGGSGDVLAIRSTSHAANTANAATWEIISIENTSSGGGGGGSDILWAVICAADSGNACSIRSAIKTDYTGNNCTDPIELKFTPIAPGDSNSPVPSTYPALFQGYLVEYVACGACSCYGGVILDGRVDRALGAVETVACNDGLITPWDGWTDITPGLCGYVPMAGVPDELVAHPGDRHTHASHCALCTPLSGTTIYLGACECEMPTPGYFPVVSCGSPPPSVNVSLDHNHSEAVCVCGSGTPLGVENPCSAAICVPPNNNPGVLNPNHFFLQYLKRTY